MSENFELMKAQVKENILVLINNDKLTQASELLNEYQQMVNDDPEVFSIRCVIAIKNGLLDEAAKSIQQGLNISKFDFDLQYNLAYIYELKEEYRKAAKIYQNLSKGSYDSEKLSLAIEAYQRLEKLCIDISDSTGSKKIKVFVKTGLDTFIDDIIHDLSDKYDVKKVIVTDLRQIDEEMPDADICWFEWCDELVIYGSKLTIAKDKKIICRLHSYEAFTDYPAKVNWDTVDKTIFVAEHIRDAVLENTPSLLKEKTVIIPNGIVLDNYTFKNRKPGFKIAYVGYINYKKGPMLLLHTFKAIYDRDHRYKLYMAGTFQDGRDVLYFRQMIRELGLEGNVFYEGWQNDVNKWLNDKDYIICTSVLEGHPVGVMEGMAKGIKPLIHNFVGARKIFPQKYIWNTIGECIEQLITVDYFSNEYRQVIEKQYSKQHQMNNILAVLDDSDNRQDTKVKPVVTVGVLNYNQQNYLAQCLDSILEQDYPNVEILIIDDGSNDSSAAIINKYTANYSNIRLICHKKNSGSTAKCIQDVQKQAKGDYFTFLKAEDYYPNKNVISTYVACALQNQDIDFFYGNQQIINDKGEAVGFNKYNSLIREKVVEQIFNDFSSTCITMYGLYKRSFYDQNKIIWHSDPSLKVGHEALNCLINIKHGWQYENLDKEMLCCRQQVSPHDLSEAVQGVSIIAEYIVDNFTEEVYLPEIKWHDVQEQKLRQAIKKYHVGAFFYRKFMDYTTECCISATSKENAEFLFRLLEPLEHKCLKFFRESLKAKETFADTVKQKQMEIVNFKKRIKDIVEPDENKIAALPKVSILIPTYNRKDMLKDALESARLQDYQNLEIIVTDNASVDGTDKFMQTYESDIRVKYFRHSENMGPGVNFWNGITYLATGEYILIIDDDDYLIDSTYISKAVRLIEQDPRIVLVYANCKLLNVDTNEVNYTNYQTAGIFNGLGFFLNYERKDTAPHIMGNLTSLVRREFLLQKTDTLAVYTYNTIAGDLISYLFLMLWGKGNIGILTDYVGVYRIHASNMSNGLRSLKLSGPQRDGTLESIEKLAEIALRQGIPEHIIDQWLDYRIWRFVRWSCCEFFSTGQMQRGVEILNSIKDKYPKPYEILKAEFTK